MILIIFQSNLIIFDSFQMKFDDFDDFSDYKECTYETDDQPYQTSEAANLLAWQPSNQLQ